MKDIKSFIYEKLNNEIEELRNLVKKFDRSKLFDNNYNLNDSVPEEFYDKLVELSNSNHPSNETLISIWKMIFSKTCIEPMVGEIIGKDCTYSTIEQDRNEKWDIKEGGKYYITKNGSALIAFIVGDVNNYAFNIASCHTDSPCLKVKGNCLLDSPEGKRINVEKYGGIMTRFP